MARNEIRLREQLPTGNIHRHRNYEVLMKKHRKSRLFRQTLRFFIYSILVTVMVLLLVALSYYVIQLKKGHTKAATERVRTS